MRQFGRLFARDVRDYRIKYKKSVRTKRTWRTQKEVLDQKDSPACVGFAWAHWLLTEPIKQYLNPFGIYYTAQFLDEWGGENYDGTSVRAGAKVVRLFGMIEEFAAATQLETIIATVLEDGPVVVGTNWYKSMDVPTKENKLKVSGRLVGGHAYLLIGVDCKKAEFTILNSWGPAWGDNGRANISFENAERLLAESGECWIGNELKSRVLI